MRSLLSFPLAVVLWIGIALSVSAQSPVEVHGDSPNFIQGSHISGKVRWPHNDNEQSRNAEVRILLVDSRQHEAVRVPGIRIDDETYFILPIPYNLAPGDYRLHVFIAKNTGVYTEDNPLKSPIITIHEGDFRTEDIPLDKSTSSLRESEDPRRYQESARLWELLSTTNDQARYFSGIMQPPLASFRVSSEFADQRRFIYSDGTESKSVHWGWDLAAPTGTPVVAPAPGRVVMALDRLITGKTVILEHLPGIYSLFYHLDSLGVTQDQTVDTDTELGTVGSTGVSTGPHLHWEMRIFTIPVHPQLFLSTPLIDMKGHLRQNGGSAE